MAAPISPLKSFGPSYPPGVPLRAGPALKLGVEATGAGTGGAASEGAAAAGAAAGSACALETLKRGAPAACGFGTSGLATGAGAAGIATGMGGALAAAAGGAAAASFELLGMGGVENPLRAEVGGTAELAAAMVVGAATAGFGMVGIAIRGPPAPAVGNEILGAPWLSAGAGTAAICASSRLPSAVPSAWHTGQCTGPGNCPFTGSTSNLYFAPQPQTIFSSIRTPPPRRNPAGTEFYAISLPHDKPPLAPVGRAPLPWRELITVSEIPFLC